VSIAILWLIGQALVADYSEVLPLLDGAAWSFGIAGKGQARITCNEKYIETFLPGPEEIDQANKDHILPAFFWGRYAAFPPPPPNTGATRLTLR